MDMRATSWRIIAASGLGLVLAGVIFSAWPGLDLTVSGWFARGTAGFAMDASARWQAVRWLFRAASDGLFVALMVWLIWNLTRPGLGRGWLARHTALGPHLRALPAARASNRALTFAVLAYVIGPGLVANALLKDHWGRARPRQITQFGGHAHFTPPLEITDQCTRNCSFVSGEGSAMVTMALVAVLLLAPRLRPAQRIWLIAGVSAYALSGSALRVAFGGHFLSDTIFAALLMGVIVPGLWLVFAGGRRSF